MADSVYPPRGPRYQETFPALTAQEIDRLRRYGSLRKYSDGEKLFEAGKVSPGMFVVLKGLVAITLRDGLGHAAPIAEQGVGQFLADVGQLSTRAALVDGIAEGDVETLLIPTEGLRALLVAEAELGARIMRAFILRRVALLEGGAAGAVLIGSPGAADVIRLQGFLTRNGYPNHLLDPARDPEAKEVIGGYAQFELKSKQEAIEGAVRFMELHKKYWPEWEGETEIRQIFGPEDFAQRAKQRSRTA